jgi:8-oxo-dGTP diphosphatase
MDMKMNKYGTFKNRYMVIPRTLVFIRKKEKYLLIKKSNKDSFGFNKFNGVGGHIEKGEEPFESALREINEETGLEIENLEFVAIVFIDTASNPGVQVFVFKANYLRGEITNSNEGTLSWMSYTNIKSSNEVLGDVPELINLCRKHKKERKSIFLKY